MATVFRPTKRRPIPAGSKITAKTQPLPAGSKIKGSRVWWRDSKGLRREGILSDTHAVTVRVATWQTHSGNKSAPVSADGKNILTLAQSYKISWYDASGKRQTRSAKTTDADAAKRMGNKHQSDSQLRRSGVINTTQERFSLEGRRPIAEHVADYRAALVARAGTAKHVELTVARVQFVLGQCGATCIEHLTASAVQQAIQTKRDAGRGLETANCYLRAIKGFTRWMWRDKRTPDDALATLAGFNTATDQRHQRRELTREELICLLAFVEQHTTPTHKLAGPDRVMLYHLALGTGFRANELRSLTVASFDLDSDPSTVTVAAAYSKHRRLDVQPIRRDLADLLRPWLEGRERDALLFGDMPGCPARMMRKDLEGARSEWIADAVDDEAEQQRREDSDFLAYQNADGLFADFHATRHTYISQVVSGGSSVKTCQELARHSDPRLTIGKYAHTRLHDLQRAIEGLPGTTPQAPAQEPLKAIGTDDNPVREGERRAQQSRGVAVRNPANGCDQETQQASTPSQENARPNVLPVADLGDAVQPSAADNEGGGHGTRTRNALRHTSFPMSQQVPESSGKTGYSAGGIAQGAAVAPAQDLPDPNLAALLDAWRTLTDDQRQRFMQIVRGVPIQAGGHLVVGHNVCVRQQERVGIDG